MHRRLHGISLLIGVVLGAGIMFLGGAAGVPQTNPPGRFQIVSVDNNSAFVLDTQSGQAAAVYTTGAGSQIVDLWKQQRER